MARQVFARGFENPYGKLARFAEAEEARLWKALRGRPHAEGVIAQRFDLIDCLGYLVSELLMTTLPSLERQDRLIAADPRALSALEWQHVRLYRTLKLGTSERLPLNEEVCRGHLAEISTLAPLRPRGLERCARPRVWGKTSLPFEWGCTATMWEPLRTTISTRNCRRSIRLPKDWRWSCMSF